MVTDARRFIIENFELICDYCLETYHSAIVWLPAQSIIRKHFATQKSDLPKVVVGLRNTWGSCEKVINCESYVGSVAFSSDGGHVVSGLQDQTVRVWNAMTGALESVLEGHSDGVLSVAFSSDGRHVVSGSRDNSIRIWNVVTGELELILE
jgi:WD40 repeat protein